jgi:hypothetical protein
MMKNCHRRKFYSFNDEFPGVLINVENKQIAIREFDVMSDPKDYNKLAHYILIIYNPEKYKFPILYICTKSETRDLFHDCIYNDDDYIYYFYAKIPYLINYKRIENDSYKMNYNSVFKKLKII